MKKVLKSRLPELWEAINKNFDLFLPDRLETGTLVIGAGYSGISFLFWNDAGL